MTRTPAEPRKTPRQRRAVETCAAIVEGAARILEAEAPGALNTNRIAERAGVGIGSLYQYFPDKRAVLVALVRRERGALLDALRAIPGDDPDPLAAMIEASVRHQFARPRLALALERIEPTLSLDAEADRMAEEIADLSRALLRRRFGARDRADFLTAVIVGRAIINAAGEGLIPAQGLAARVEHAIAGCLERLRAGGEPG